MMLRYKKETNCTSTCVKLGKLLTEEIMYSAVGHIGVWVRASEQADDEGEVGHLIINIIIICIIIMIISIISIISIYIIIIMAVTWSTVGTRSQKRITSQHWEARLPSPDIVYPGLGTTSLFRAHSPDPIFTMRPILGYRLFPYISIQKFKDIVMN